jgi:hypothetical protein
MVSAVGLSNGVDTFNRWLGAPLGAGAWNGEPRGTSKEWRYPMNAVTETTNAQRRSVFSRVLVGIDGSEESREAARQAAILVNGELTLLAAYDVAPAIGGTGAGVPAYLDEDLQRATATDALGRIREEIAVASPAGKIVRSCRRNGPSPSFGESTGRIWHASAGSRRHVAGAHRGRGAGGSRAPHRLPWLALGLLGAMVVGGDGRRVRGRTCRAGAAGGLRPRGRRHGGRGRDLDRGSRAS